MARDTSRNFKAMPSLQPGAKARNSDIFSFEESMISSGYLIIGDVTNRKQREQVLLSVKPD
jgi:hypothetical protein